MNVQASVIITLEGICAAVLVIMFLFSLVEWKSGNESRFFIGMMLALIVATLTDFLAWLHEFNMMHAPEAIKYIVLSLNYIGCYIAIFFFIRYLREFIKDRCAFTNNVIRVLDILSILSVMSVLLNPLFGFFFYFEADGSYVIGDYYWAANLYSLLSLSFLFFDICSTSSLKVSDKAVFLTYPVFPLIGMIFDYYVYVSVLTYVGAFFSVVVIYLQVFVQRGRRLAEQSAELAQSRIAIMLSQIQPHFLYNALATIKYLCSKRDPRAEEVVDSFSKYLRGNMDSLTSKDPIPFERELEHLRHYLAIETLRFPNVLVEYDIITMAFSLPALTIQPLVENAIRYGVNRKPDGTGSVSVSSFEDDKAYYVRIADDGIGFDPEQTQYDGRSHIGISNTRQRLAVMCRGSLTVESVPGSGTTITITIPKEKRTNDSLVR